MKHITIISLLALSSLNTFAEGSEDGHLIAQISRQEAPVSWHLTDGTELRDVSVTKTTKGKWVEIEYSLRIRRAPGKPQDVGAKPAKAPRLRCWVHVDHVTRIVPAANRPRAKK